MRIHVLRYDKKRKRWVKPKGKVSRIPKIEEILLAYYTGKLLLMYSIKGVEGWKRLN